MEISRVLSQVITSVEGYGIARQKLLERQLVVDDSASGLVYQPLEEPEQVSSLNPLSASE